MCIRWFLASFSLEFYFAIFKYSAHPFFCDKQLMSSARMVARNYATTVVLALLYHTICTAVVELPLLVDASAAGAAPRDPDQVAAGEEGDRSNTKRPPGFLSSAGVQVSVKYLSGGDLFEFSLPASEVATATAGHVTAAYAHRYPGSGAHLVLVSAVQRGAGGGDAGAGPEAEDRNCVVLPLAPQAVLRDLPRLQRREAEEPRSWVFQGVLQPLVGFTFAKWGRLAPFDAKEWHAPDPVGGFRLLSELGGDGLLAFQQLPIHQLAKDFEWALFRGGRTAQLMPGRGPDGIFSEQLASRRSPSLAGGGV